MFIFLHEIMLIYKYVRLTKLVIHLLLTLKGGKIMDKRSLFTIIFGKECVSDEELWDAGFGDCGRKIEVEIENISQYSKYKRELLWRKMLNQIGDIETSWINLPKKQKEQIEVIMKIIAYAVISLKDCVTVNNITGTTLQFLQKLGYNAWGSSHSGWINLYNAQKVELVTGYLTAETAENLSNAINKYVLNSFLKEKKKEGKQYVIIPTDSIHIRQDLSIEEEKALTNDILEQLGLEFDLETFVTFHSCESLAFIDLRHFGIAEGMQTQLEPLKKYLAVEL